VTKEIDIERYLVECVKALGGETRKVQWVGRNGAPDRVVFLPDGRVLWVEVKSPSTWASFPNNAHERAQHREHQRMRALGQEVFVVGTLGQVNDVLS
jgi:hypothetical protein